MVFHAGAEPSVPAQQTRNDIDIGTSLTGALQLGTAGELTTYADEIRIGTSYGDMFGSIPEPTSTSLIIFGSILLSIRSRIAELRL